MRHLHPTFLETTLRRGKSIELFIGGHDRAGERMICWLEVRPNGNEFEVWKHEAPDIGDTHRLDIYAFDGVENLEAPLATTQSAEDALSYAHSKLGASSNRWVNQGVTQEEYKDFILAGRPSRWPSVGV